MTNFNSVVLEGNLTKDPELKYLNNGTALCQFTIGVNRSFKQDDEWKDEASFFDVQVWAKLAEWVANNTHKGKPVVVVGRLKQERWESNGSMRSRVLVIASGIRPVEKVERSDG